MKKLSFIMLFLALLTFLSSCSNRGDISRVNMDYGESELYTQDEISSAMDVVITYFYREFAACTLTELWYDEEKTSDAAEEWADNSQADEAIILLSNYKVGRHGASIALNPGETYSEWQWILVKDADGNWSILTCGYG